MYFKWKLGLKKRFFSFLLLNGAFIFAVLTLVYSNMHMLWRIKYKNRRTLPMNWVKSINRIGVVDPSTIRLRDRMFLSIMIYFSNGFLSKNTHTPIVLRHGRVDQDGEA